MTEHHISLQATASTKASLHGTSTGARLVANWPWFGPTIALALVSPVPGFWLSGWESVGYGLLINIIALLLGFKGIRAAIRQIEFDG